MAQDTIIEAFWRRVKETPERPAIYHKIDGEFKPVIWREHGRIVELLAGGLLKNGVNKGDHVAIMSQSRPHWTWADLATLSIGCATVPIYPTLAAPESQFLARHSDAVAAFVENDRQAKKLLDSPEPLERLLLIVVMDGQAPKTTGSVRCISWVDLLKDGEVFLPANPDKLAEHIAQLTPSTLASIVYTSGTTGVPKGVMLLHSNVYSVCKAMSKLVKFEPIDTALSFLPLSHVYERVGGQFLAIYDGLPVAYAESIEAVPQNLVEVKPTVLNGVPRFYEKAYQRIQAEIRRLPKAQQYLIRWALALGKRAAKYADGHDDLVKQIYRHELRVADRLVFSRIRRRFGGRLRMMTSGAAPLSDEVQGFFETIGMHMYEGYGLTETSAPATCNTPDDSRRGTVGRPLPGVELKIAEDGEILVRGPSVFIGYYKNEQATKEALQDGWFMTGDIGEIDSDGYLRIKDRKKDIIITAGGKHIAPQFIENLYRGEALISNIVVFGDRRKYLTALLTLNMDGIKALATAENISFKEPADLIHHPRIRQALEELIQQKNEALASFERIKKFAILQDDFSAENNELTPTFKLKRKVITDKYKSVIDGMYDAVDLELEDGVSKK